MPVFSILLNTHGYKLGSGGNTIQYHGQSLNRVTITDHFNISEAIPLLRLTECLTKKSSDLKFKEKQCPPE